MFIWCEKAVFLHRRCLPAIDLYFLCGYTFSCWFPVKSGKNEVSNCNTFNLKHVENSSLVLPSDFATSFITLHPKIDTNILVGKSFKPDNGDEVCFAQVDLEKLRRESRLTLPTGDLIIKKHSELGMGKRRVL